MEVIYTLSNGRKIEAFLSKYSDKVSYRYLKQDGTCYPKSIEVKTEGDPDSDQKYFLIKDEKKYCDEFDYDPIDVLIERIKISKSILDLRDGEILATFLKDTDNIGIITELRTRSWTIIDNRLVFFWNLKEYSDPVMCIPTERNYRKVDWDYKLSLEVEDETLKEFLVGQDYYFSDFCSMLRRGHMSLVNKNNYKKENEPMTYQKLLRANQK